MTKTTQSIYATRNIYTHRQPWRIVLKTIKEWKLIDVMVIRADGYIYHRLKLN